ncbi:MAG TPA: hypothetical protein VFH33_01485 [Candidatus Krumholzibacteria bacterium]|nr:hypothetical protein [Candidatus Krumholzibacteria bacterium]
MKHQVSPWVRKTITVYVALVVGGTVLGVLSGGLGGIWVLPLIQPWAFLQLIVDEHTGGALLDSVWWGPASSLVFCAINAALLYWILRLIDRSRRRQSEQRKSPSWITIVLVTYVVLLASGFTFGILAGERGVMLATAIVMPLTFPWFFVLWWVEVALGWQGPFTTGFWSEHLPELVGGVINFFLLLLVLKLLDRRRTRKQSPAPDPGC